MKTELFIPTTVTVGCQKRNDTYTGKLAYVIYTDNKGVLRKEKSWQGWRDQSIPPEQFNNVPTTGFTFNKGVQRYGDWHSSGRSMVRVWDPRGFEFEVSIENLIGLLMHSDVSKRDIVQPCVYAWHGTELILLPTNSEVYETSVNHTAKQDMKVKAKELGIGYTYEIKSTERHVVYIGKFTIYQDKEVKVPTARWAVMSKIHAEKKNQHIFYEVDTKTFVVKSPTAYIAKVVSEECHPEYADLVDQYYKLKMSQPIQGLKLIPHVPKGNWDNEANRYHHDEKYQGHYYASAAFDDVLGYIWMEVAENKFIQVKVEVDMYKTNYYMSTPQPPSIEVVWKKSMSYDPETRTTSYSVEAETSGYRDRYEAVHIEDLRITSPLVANAIEAIRQDLSKALYGWLCVSRDNMPLTEQLRSHVAAVVAVAAAHKFGEVRAVLPKDVIAYKDYDSLPDSPYQIQNRAAQQAAEARRAEAATAGITVEDGDDDTYDDE